VAVQTKQVIKYMHKGYNKKHTVKTILVDFTLFTGHEGP
jgi:hypothetical protein